MKKLMTMLAAAAMAFGLFADGATLTGAKSFAAEALTDNYGPSITLANGWGEYTGTAGTLKITGTEGQDDHVLQMKTGSAALKRNVLSDGTAKAVDGNVYFDTMIDLNGEALTEFPTVDDDAKLAIFAYDNTDDLEGTQTEPWTAFYALAKDGNGTTMLYQISTGVASWNSQHRITVQAYENIMKSGSTENVGFKIFFDGGQTEEMKNAAIIEAAYAFDNDGKVIWTKNEFDEDTYLAGKVQPKFASSKVRKTLFVGLVAGNEGQSLTSMDFQGNAKMANIEINDTGFPFIAPDIQVMTLVQNNVTVTAEPAAALEGDNIVDDCTLTITPDTGKTIITYNYNADEPTVLDGNTLDVTFTPNATLTITAVAPAATVTVDGETYQVATLDEAIEAVNGATEQGKLALEQVVVLAEGEQISFNGVDVILDLNGKTITGAGDGDNETVIYNKGKLTITDTSVGQAGSVVSTAAEDAVAVYNGESGVLAIDAGTFVGAISDVNDPAATTLTGGKYTQADNDEDVLKGFLEEGYQVVADGELYWKVVEVTTVDVTFTVNNASVVKVEQGGEEITPVVDVYTVEPNVDITVTLEAADGYFLDSNPQVVQATDDGEIALTDAKELVATFTDCDGNVTKFSELGYCDNSTTAGAGAIFAWFSSTGGTLKVEKDCDVGIAKMHSSSAFVTAKGEVVIDLNGKTITCTNNYKYAFQLLKDTKVTFRNGTIKSNAGNTALVTFFQNYATTVLEDVTVDADNIPVTLESELATGAAVFAVMNGSVTLQGDTSVVNVHTDAAGNGYLLSIGNHAGDYPSRAFTINTDGTLSGNFRMCGGTVTYVKGTLDTNAKYSYGLAINGNAQGGTVNTRFTASDLVNFPMVATVGKPFDSEKTITVPAGKGGYEVLGSFYVAVDTAETDATAQAKTLTLIKPYALTADKTFSCTVEVSEVKITLDTFKLTTPNLLTDAAFVIPEKKAVKVTGEGPYTYELTDAAQPIDPTKPAEPFDKKDDADARAAEINANKATMITVPAEMTSVKDSYIANVEAKVVPNASTGKYDVIVDVIESQGVKDNLAAADATVAAKLGDVAVDDAEVSIAAIPGLYYSAFEGATVELGDETDRVPATGDSVTIKLDHYEGAGFYQIKVSAAPAE